MRSSIFILILGLKSMVRASSDCGDSCGESFEPMPEASHHDCMQACDAKAESSCKCSQVAHMIPYPKPKKQCQPTCHQDHHSCVPCEQSSHDQSQHTHEKHVHHIESVTIDKIVVSTTTETKREVSTAPASTITVKPDTVTFTRAAKPVTVTLPPLVMQIPTTHYKKSKPETIVRTLPPQVIYQSPKTRTVTHKVIMPASTITVTTAHPPIVLPAQIKTVRGPKEVKYVTSPPMKYTIIKSSISYVTQAPKTHTVTHHITLPAHTFTLRETSTVTQSRTIKSPPVTSIKVQSVTETKVKTQVHTVHHVDQANQSQSQSSGCEEQAAQCEQTKPQPKEEHCEAQSSCESAPEPEQHSSGCTEEHSSSCEGQQKGGQGHSSLVEDHNVDGSMMSGSNLASSNMHEDHFMNSSSDFVASGEIN